MHDALEVTDELARGWGGGGGGRVTGRGYAPACAGLEAQDSYELRVTLFCVLLCFRTRDLRAPRSP